MEAIRPDRVIEALNEAGFEAYYVGGCVRDRLLRRPIHDWDITTAAHPEQIMSLFARCIPTGAKHGTVTVLEDGFRAEVTTFRADGAYLDGRHPQAVRFVPSLQEDLARRDFTVNAMAMDAGGRITDLFGGQRDLKARRIRCVGDPETRFREDALRMLRAYRFSAQLGFSIDPETAAAARRWETPCAALSIERIRDEMEKTLCSPAPQLLCEMAGIGLLRPAGIDALPALDELAALPPEPAIRWSALKRRFPALDPTRLRLPGRLCTQISAAAQSCQSNMDALALKRCAAQYGWEVAEIAAALTGTQALAADLRASGACVSLRQLAVSGRDFPALHGAQIGAMLHRLLNHVLEHPEDNTRAALLALAERLPPD